MDRERIERVREFCNQITAIELQIWEVMEGNGQPLTTLKKQPGPKPRINNPNSPWRVGGGRRGRQKKIRNYVCEDCGKPSVTNLPPSIARCLECRSKNITEREIDGAVKEFDTESDN